MTAGQLRICMLGVHSCPLGTLGAKDTGGMSVYIREVARELGKQGFLVDVYTRVHDPQDEKIMRLGRNTRLIHLRAGEDENMHKLVLYAYLSDFACNVENFRNDSTIHYDLLFSHYWLSGWAGELLRRWWNIPHVIMFHTLGAVKNAVGIGEDEPELRIETERQLAGDCQRIIAATEKEKGDLILRYGALPDRISVVPCGVNLALFQPKDKEAAKQQLGFGGDRVILFVGRIEPLKGIDQLLRAMTYLPGNQRLRLAIIGGDEHSQYEIERLQNLSRDLRIEGSVVFPGIIEHEKLPDYYSAADVCVLPSYYESFGLVALESMACGTPVVATEAGGFKDIIRQGETGYVVADNAPRHLAEKIALLLSRPGNDMKLALSIRESVTRFSWSNVADAVIRECRPVLT